MTPFVHARVEKRLRCRKRFSGGDGQTGPQCHLPKDHDGPCLFKCCGGQCPGLPYPASVRPHPESCLRLEFRPEGKGA